MTPSLIAERYRALQEYVGWSPADRRHLERLGQIVLPQLAELVDDFYEAILASSEAATFITGGVEQVARLKCGLRGWLEALFLGDYDRTYAVTRWQVGRRHVEIGLDQAFTIAAMSRLRCRILRVLDESSLPAAEQYPLRQSLSKLIDLDLALIEDAYQAELLARQQPVDQARLRQQSAVTQISRRALNSGALEPLFHYAVALTADVVRASQCLLLKASDDHQSFLPQAGYGLDWERAEARLIPRSQGYLSGRTMATEEAVIVADYRAGSPFATDPLPDQERVISSLSVPVFARKGVWGVFAVHTFEPRNFQQTDLDCLQAIANVLSAAIDRNESQQMLIQNERLAGIGQMITGIAHESRNALQRIQACTEMLEMEVAGQAEARDLVSRIERAQDDLNRLFNEVRSYAAAIRLECSPCDVASIWQEAWDQLESERRQRHATLCERRRTPAIVAHLDRYRMVQVFRNLFENSLSVCPDPVQIDIVCHRIHTSQHGAVEIVVRDNGPGLDESTLLHAFDPFYTTKTKGTGLGLAIARRIVEAHRGSIEIASAATSGAEFVIRLPVRT